MLSNLAGAAQLPSIKRDLAVSGVRREACAHSFSFVGATHSQQYGGVFSRYLASCGYSCRGLNRLWIPAALVIARLVVD